MNTQCKAMAGLLAAGIAVVVGGPAKAAGASMIALPSPTTYSTAGLFTPVAQTPPLHIPVRLSRSARDSLSAAANCSNGSDCPTGLDSAEPDFHNASYQLIDCWYYTWNPLRPAAQPFGTFSAAR
jgi:hypothetical protein